MHLRIYRSEAVLYLCGCVRGGGLCGVLPGVDDSDDDDDDNDDDYDDDVADYLLLI